MRIIKMTLRTIAVMATIASIFGLVMFTAFYMIVMLTLAQEPYFVRSNVTVSAEVRNLKVADTTGEALTIEHQRDLLHSKWRY